MTIFNQWTIRVEFEIFSNIFDVFFFENKKKFQFQFLNFWSQNLQQKKYESSKFHLMILSNENFQIFFLAMQIYLFGCFMSVIITSIVGEKLTDNECNQIGYNPAELFCSRCLELTKFELDNLKDSCMKCCRQDDDSNSKKV